MKCPHCLVAVHVVFAGNYLMNDKTHQWNAEHAECPNCGRAIIRVIGYSGDGDSTKHISVLAHPKRMSRSPVPAELPERFASDYREAGLVLADSAKASPALSRRCLQDLLREKAAVKHSNLDNEIQQVIDEKGLPSWLSDDLDAVRVVGNFAAHPIKSTNTGEVVDVEPGEAEWLLDVLDGLFDFYFVEPEKARKRREALNAKLQEAGKHDLKTSS